MAHAGRKKNYASITDVRIYHDPNTDTIKIITADPDLTGQPFLIELTEKTETENTLRTLLQELEIIPTPTNLETETPTNTTQIQTITKLPTQPDLTNDTYEEATTPRQHIPIGQRNSTQTPLWLNLKENPNTLILGTTENGTRRLIRNITNHLNQHPTVWKQIILDLNNEMLPNTQPNTNTTIINNYDEAEEALDKIYLEIDRRHKLVDNENSQTYTKLTNPPHNLAIITLNYQKYYQCDPNQTDRITHKLNRLKKLAHKVGIHIITHTTHNPNPTENLTENYQNRIYIGPDKNTEERTNLQPGQGILKTNQDNTYTFTIYKQEN